MQLLKTVQQLEHLNYLIRTHSTGNPSAFASRLQLSERQLYRLIEELRDLGFPIRYSVKQHFYYYSEDVELTISARVNGKKIIGR